MDKNHEHRFLIALTTVPSEDLGRRIAHACVSSKLVACAQLGGPVTSFYYWDDALVSDVEWRLELKLSKENVEKVKALVMKMHSYDVPQWIELDVVGSEAYAAWINSSA